jgi:hypothetical protein
MNLRRFLSTVWCLPYLLTILHAADNMPSIPIKLTPLSDRVRVEINGQPFTEYVFGDGASRPYCYPLFAADGTAMTRDFPMKTTPGEETDHPWHRSLWFAHSMANNIDFWNEGHGDAGHSPEIKGRIVQDQLLATNSGNIGILRTRNRWVTPDERIICRDERILRFQATTETRIMDFEVTIQALPNKPLVMGDNKDGTMAMRLAQWMTMPHKSQSQGTHVAGAGHIVTSTGFRDNDAWGKRADWCDYFAEHNGQTYGVAIFDHPHNPRHPTWWQARDYGLFGANPFGQHDYENRPDQPHLGDYTIPAGGSLRLRYRFYFHMGNETAARIAEHYADYAAEN